MTDIHDITDAPARTFEPGERPPNTDLVLNPQDPLPSARKFAETRYTASSARTLHHHLGVFYTWDGACYQPLDEQTARAEVYAFLELARRRVKGELKPYQPNRSKVAELLDALRAETNLPADIEPPTWLDYVPDMSPAPNECLSCKNGLLHLPTLELLDPSPRLFTMNAVDFAYDPAAPIPVQWLKFLKDLWSEDKEAIGTWQELLGYFLVSDTSQQKIALVAGPKRSGKGTLGRVVTALVGRGNVVAPTLASLGTNFGLAPLINKTVAIIADARIGGRADQHAIAERLLSISGEDNLTLDRKYLCCWTGRLPTRFLILTNELPRIADTSGALASRFIVFTLTRSFYGKEDHTLTDRLLTELPGILNWAIAGWRRLRERGHFVQPASSAEAIRAMEDLGSPVAAFLRDDCVIDPSVEVLCANLFSAWKNWCEANGRSKPGTAQSFGRDLRAAVPGLKVTQPREEGSRERWYQGVMFK